MKWEAIGADRQSGQALTMEIDAPSEAEAVKVAGQTMLIERVREIPPLQNSSPKPPKQREALDEAQIEDRRRPVSEQWTIWSCSTMAILAYMAGAAQLCGGCADGNAISSSTHTLAGLLTIIAGAIWHLISHVVQSRHASRLKITPGSKK